MIRSQTIIKDLSKYSAIEGKFKSEVHEGEAYIDTSVDIHIKDICIAWNDKNKLMDEISTTLKKYII